MSGSPVPTASNASDAVLFEVVIVPNRSLGPAGLAWVGGSLMGLSAGISVGLWLAGAWPAVGFMGAEALLAVWLLRRHARPGRASEMLLLTETELRILRTDRAGRRRELRLGAAWLRATVRERPGTTPSLLVQDGTTVAEVGCALGEAEKRELAAQLQEALRRRRHPLFDNPQLRGPNPPPAPST